MRHINPGKAAISVGAVIGLWHLMWVALVALGWAKPVMDFNFRLHFIELEAGIAPFVAATAAMLVALTFTLGALFGLIFAVVWNWLGEKTGEAAPQASQARVM
jgi:hypothetical protein